MGNFQSFVNCFAGMNSDELMRTGCKTNYDTDTISTPVLSVISEISLIDDQNSDCYPAAAFNSNNSANFYSQFKLLFKRSVYCTLRDWVTIIKILKKGNFQKSNLYN